MSETLAIREIHNAVRQTAKAEETRLEARDVLRNACWNAREQGLSLAQIAEEAGLSLQGLDDLLAERSSR